MVTTQKSILFFIFFTIFSLVLPSLCRAHLPVQSLTPRHGPEVILSEQQMAQLFQQWREKHGRVYDHAEETLKRYENFKRNVKFIVGTNMNQTGFTVGLNRFADLSNEEFKENYFGKWKKPVHVKGSQTRMAMTCDAPKNLDWREKGVVTPVKDQGTCGGCWAFSSTGAIEGINAINNGELISLSEQELIDCDTIDKGCDGGNMDNAYQWVVHNGGIDTEADYPYIGLGASCKANLVANEVVSIDGYEDVERSETSLLCATINQPVSVGIQGSSMDFQLYTGGIYDGSCSSSPHDIDHAVLIVGYGSEDGKDYWIVKNSWGTFWGMNGYMHLRRNTDIPNGVCGVNIQASYPTQTPSSPSPYSPASSPQPPPPPYSPPPKPSPPPPSPAPTVCGDFSYCPAGQTCCCIVEFYDYCLMYGCCEYDNAVCCADSDSCCPQEYPICDNVDGFCLKKRGDILGVTAKKKKFAKHKLPWSNKFEQGGEMIYEPLQWKRNNQFAAMR